MQSAGWSELTILTYWIQRKAQFVHEPFGYLSGDPWRCLKCGKGGTLPNPFQGPVCGTV